MRMYSLFYSTVGACILFSTTVMADVALNGRDATPQMIMRVARGEAVTVEKDTLDKVAKAYAVLLQGAKEGQEIYGLTVGVGWNKDRKMVDATGELTPALMEASREFNEGLLRAHSVGVGPDTDLTVVRAAMAVRLNNILTGGPGVQPHVAEIPIAFLNKGITPTMPSRGSVGQAARARSMDVCELCGRPGEIRRVGWHRVRCDGCETEHVRRHEFVGWNRKDIAEAAAYYIDVCLEHGKLFPIGNIMIQLWPDDTERRHFVDEVNDTVCWWRAGSMIQGVNEELREAFRRLRFR